MTPTIVLLAGASGVGKTRVSHRLAARLDAALVEVDDLLIAVQSLTTPQSHPDLHYWTSRSDAGMTIAADNRQATNRRRSCRSQIVPSTIKARRDQARCSPDQCVQWHVTSRQGCENNNRRSYWKAPARAASSR